MRVIQRRFVERGVWIRPFGKLVYIMPPYIIRPDELTRLTSAMKAVVSGADCLLLDR
jgi:adenosylmethionine-8-amino-7-oxononanoate aminotransferase